MKNTRHAPTFNSWRGMHHRCRYKSDKRYRDYGGKGITICKRWFKFENFLKDMGERPKGKTLDRINNKGNYNKSNCRWATSLEQRLNRKDVVLITYKGKTQSLKQWSNELNIPYMRLYSRYRAGWSKLEILSTPKKINQFL